MFLLAVVSNLTSPLPTLCYPPLILMCQNQVFLSRFYEKVVLATNLTSQQRKGSVYLTIILSSTYFLFLPVLMTNDSILLVLLGTLWIP
jgi:hypothetical protein